MKVWTVQNKVVFDEINTSGAYWPNFLKSEYIRTNPKLVDLYSVLIMNYNSINNSALLGVVFGFLGINDTQIFEFPTFENFYQYIRTKSNVIESLWNQLLKREDMFIMELDYKEDFNPLFIDINDFQFLMPPIMILPPYVESDVARISRNLANGTCSVSPLPSGIIQAHLPYIKRENITNIYKPFLLK
ncbi:MAG: hypothetical protein K2J40_00505 [Ruminococcus sp.]|nr:hypothetical protein [Ruminococcus sp.]